MDMLFLEEFATNRAFLHLFLNKIKGVDLADYEVRSAETSFVDPDMGESDLTICLEKAGHWVSLLIEDKINAVAQPRQYERYVERGEKCLRENAGSDCKNICDAFYVFLIAPEQYIQGNPSAEKYPLKVTYEECRDLFTSSSDARSQLKYQQLTEAITQAHKPYTKIVDETATNFGKAYVRYMQNHYPDLELKSKVVAKSKKGDWPTYQTSLDMKQVYIHQKTKMSGVDYSYIDLTFSGLGEYREQLKDLLKDMLKDQYDPHFAVKKAGKSAVLRLVAFQYLDWQKPFEEQKDTVEEHLRLITRLCEAARQMDKKRLIAFYEEVAPKEL